MAISRATATRRHLELTAGVPAGPVDSAPIAALRACQIYHCSPEAKRKDMTAVCRPPGAERGVEVLHGLARHSAGIGETRIETIGPEPTAMFRLSTCPFLLGAFVLLPCLGHG